MTPWEGILTFLVFALLWRLYAVSREEGIKIVIPGDANDDQSFTIKADFWDMFRPNHPSIYSKVNVRSRKDVECWIAQSDSISRALQEVLEDTTVQSMEDFPARMSYFYDKRAKELAEKFTQDQELKGQA